MIAGDMPQVTLSDVANLLEPDRGHVALRRVVLARSMQTAAGSVVYMLGYGRLRPQLMGVRTGRIG